MSQDTSTRLAICALFPTDRIEKLSADGVERVKIEGSRDCGNSPKNRFVQEFAIALETGELSPESVSQSVVWEGVLEAPINGTKDLFQLLGRRKKLRSIVVEHAISHGKVGAASGRVIHKDGEQRRFSHFVEFTNTKANCVLNIKSYS